MNLIPYLTFNGNAEEALTFYKSVFSGETAITRFSEMPEDPKMPVSDAWKNKIMHASLQISEDLMIYFSDAFEGGEVNVGDNINLHIEFGSEDELRKTFDALSAGGTITMPVDKMFWGAVYGSLIDQFGIPWGLHLELSE